MRSGNAADEVPEAIAAKRRACTLARARSTQVFLASRMEGMARRSKRRGTTMMSSPSPFTTRRTWRARVLTRTVNGGDFALRHPRHDLPSARESGMQRDLGDRGQRLRYRTGLLRLHRQLLEPGVVDPGDHGLTVEIDLIDGRPRA